MKRLATGIGAVLALCTAASAQAAGTYFGVTAGLLRFHQDGATTAEMPMVEAKAGKRFNEYVGLELRYGAGTSDDDVVRAGAPLHVEFDRYYGLYGLALYPMSYELSFYGLLGITRGEISASPEGLAPSTSDVGGTYGLGMEVRVGSASAVTLEWVQLLGESDFEATTLTAGISFRF